MQDKRVIIAPAKLNIFLKILGRREDGYHTLHSGVTFINLFDSIEIEESSKNEIIYKGPFKPKQGYFYPPEAPGIGITIDDNKVESEKELTFG